MAKPTPKAAPAVKPSWAAKPADPVVAETPAATDPVVAAATEVAPETAPVAPVVNETIVDPVVEASEAAPAAKAETITVVAKTGFTCNLSMSKVVRVEAGVQEMEPELAKELSEHWYAKAHGFEIYSKG